MNALLKQTSHGHLVDTASTAAAAARRLPVRDEYGAGSGLLYRGRGGSRRIILCRGFGAIVAGAVRLFWVAPIVCRQRRVRRGDQSRRRRSPSNNIRTGADERQPPTWCRLAGVNLLPRSCEAVLRGRGELPLSRAREAVFELPA